MAVAALVAMGAVLGGLARGAAAPPAQAYTAEQVALGGQVFAAECARCHGARGEGAGPEAKDAPLVVGPRGLSGFRDVAQLYEYVTESMPQDRPGTLTDEQYWAVLSWLLAQNGLSEPGTPLGPGTAGAIPLRR